MKNFEHAYVKAQVFGLYTHGERKGQTNPKSVVTGVWYGDSVKQAIGRMKAQIAGAFFKVVETRERDQIHAIEAK